MHKVNVSLPDDVLRELDRAARDSKASRSAFLALAVKRFIAGMEEEKQLKQRRQAAEAIDRFREEFGAWDGTAEVLKWREKGVGASA